jgi:hypothetical protein
MKLETYAFTQRRKSYYYEFYSEGPNGRIQKVVEFYHLDTVEAKIYNLSFGDWQDQTSRINDLSVSNNNGRDKILATVAAIIVEFLKEHPDAVIFAEGSTLSRTRLYQVSISRQWHEISAYFKVYGYVNNKWEFFQKGTNYSAFLFNKK